MLGEIQKRNLFNDVRCAFWKEEPSLGDAIFLFDPETVASPSVKLPHQPVDIVQRPNPTSLTVRSVLL